jgi:hypothetical protein
VWCSPSRLSSHLVFFFLVPCAGIFVDCTFRPMGAVNHGGRNGRRTWTPEFCSSFRSKFVFAASFKAQSL